MCKQLINYVRVRNSVYNINGEVFSSLVVATRVVVVLCCRIAEGCVRVTEGCVRVPAHGAGNSRSLAGLCSFYSSAICIGLSCQKKQQCVCVHVCVCVCSCMSVYLHVQVVCVYLICLYIVGRLVFTYVLCGCCGSILRPGDGTDN